jgi:hypothetical protein
VPRQQTLEDSILTWLNAPDEAEPDDATAAQPRIISMPAADAAGESAGRRIRGTIRMKEQQPKEETA